MEVNISSLAVGSVAQPVLARTVEQTHGITLSYAQDLLTHLVAECVKARSQPPAPGHNPALNYCKLGKDYIGPTRQKLVSPHFHNGVIKIQKIQGGRTHSR